VRLFRQFAQAPKLRKIKIDLDKMNPIPALKPFFSSENSVRSLNILNFSLLSGIEFLSALAESKNLEKLTIQFSRPDPKGKQKEFEFPQGSSCSVKSLKINYHSVSMCMNTVHDKQWSSFFTMFTNLEHLEISNGNFSKGTKAYFEELLYKLPLKSLTLKNCLLTSEIHQAIFHSLQSVEKCRL
jgi:Ran GTPase-activating protein (RanGAP) involved in mRNA processing and transport